MKRNLMIAIFALILLPAPVAMATTVTPYAVFGGRAILYNDPVLTGTDQSCPVGVSVDGPECSLLMIGAYDFNYLRDFWSYIASTASPIHGTFFAVVESPSAFDPSIMRRDEVARLDFYPSLRTYSAINFEWPVPTFWSGGSYCVIGLDTGCTVPAFLLSASVPEPTSWLIMGMGLLMVWRRMEKGK